jgi:hypothetical protein
VAVSQDATGGRFLPNGIPYYTATITNACLECTVRDVHVSCGVFASSEYSNSFPYELQVASVSCG